MAMNRAARLNQTVPVEVTFQNGDLLNIEARRVNLGYGRIKELTTTSREAQRITARIGLLKRNLERMPVPELPVAVFTDDANRETAYKFGTTAEEERAAFEAQLEQAKAEREKVLTAREPIEAELVELDAKSTESIESLIKWMAGDQDQTAAIADWDFYEDEAKTAKVEITRSRIEEFLPEEIALLAGKILEKLSVGESKPAS